MNKYLLTTGFVLINLYLSSGIPIAYRQIQIIPVPVLQSNDPQRSFWNFIGDFLAQNGYIPIEINVPDTVGAIYNGAQNVYNGISTFAGNIIQRLPFVNRLTSPENPRPYRLILLLPVQMPQEPKLILPIGNIPHMLETPNLQYDENGKIAETEPNS